MKGRHAIRWVLWYFVCSYLGLLLAQITMDIIYPAAWAGNSINSLIFRKNSLSSNSIHQFTAFYDDNGFVVVGKRTPDLRSWEFK